jgi:hypothetical protein
MEGLAAFMSWQRKRDQGRALLRADPRPERLCLHILAKHQQMAFGDALTTKCRDALLNQQPAQTKATMPNCHDQVMNETTTPIVPTKNGADKMPVFSIAQTDAIGALPKTNRRRIVSQTERANLDTHER